MGDPEYQMPLLLYDTTFPVGDQRLLLRQPLKHMTVNILQVTFKQAAQFL